MLVTFGLKGLNGKIVVFWIGCLLAWENSWHLTTLPLVSPPNDVGETSVEILYWWSATTQIWVVTLHQYRISALVSQMSFGRETSGSIAKCWLFSQAMFSQASFLLELRWLLTRGGHIWRFNWITQHTFNRKITGWGIKVIDSFILCNLGKVSEQS